MMTERSAARLRVAGLLGAAVVVQTSVGADLRVDGVAPDLILLVTLCAGLFGGPRQGVLVGFAGGLLADVFLVDTPLGLSALTWCLVGYAVGVLRATALPDGWAVVPVVVLAGTAAGIVAFVGIGDIVGQHQLVAGGRSWLVRVVVVESVLNAVLSVPVAWLYDRAARGSEGAAAVGRGRPEQVAR